ncbi:MAG: acyl-CoA thioesterase [Pedobacter sp.]|nr:MAG: acyl-CoA thioesterase [Pedobacter sp.]
MAIFDFLKTIWRSEPIKVDKKSEFSSIHDFKYKTRIDVRFQDFDMMGHVNNAVYFTYMEIGRTKYWTQAINWNWAKTGVIIGSASIKYIKPVHANETLNMYVRTSRIGSSSFDLEYLLTKVSGGQEEICSQGKTTCIAFDYGKKQSVPVPSIERNKMIEFEQLV